jgi:hypothetical protein
MKYWEIIADKLSKAGWSLGWVSAVDSTSDQYSILALTAATIGYLILLLLLLTPVFGFASVS